jgi:AcrR family transcriptional regulator
MNQPSPGPRPLRADAQRNRARLLDVAELVFATHGVAASTEEIARQAGVGIGTVFRHFPTKEALLEAVFRRRLQQLAAHADALADTRDPGAAFFGFISHVVELAVTQRAQIDALAEAGVDLQTATSDDKQELQRALGALLARAQEAGAVRADVGIADVFAILVGASRAAEFAGQDTALRVRSLGVILDGLRPRSSFDVGSARNAERR